MIAGTILVAIGFACGLFLRFVFFAAVLVVIVAARAIAIAAAGTTGWALAYEIVFALIALQVGYFLAVVYRIAWQRRRAGLAVDRGAPTSDEPRKEGPPLHARTFGKPLP
jgi:hypothetical protein